MVNLTRHNRGTGLDRRAALNIGYQEHAVRDVGKPVTF
jgi:hypothetical protein